mmetsp:Transcript_21193/g.20346  ORF Transcript_21193/g.20346 Transcript_21193/m.20346 type:complete len:204 (+) Transcript_21193:1234-1845(+)
MLNRQHQRRLPLIVPFLNDFHHLRHAEAIFLVHQVDLLLDLLEAAADDGLMDGLVLVRVDEVGVLQGLLLEVLPDLLLEVWLPPHRHRLPREAPDNVEGSLVVVVPGEPHLVALDDLFDEVVLDVPDGPVRHDVQNRVPHPVRHHRVSPLLYQHVERLQVQLRSRHMDRCLPIDVLHIHIGLAELDEGLDDEGVAPQDGLVQR